jgi:transcriptional regulator GlxA family with amidase domain
MSTDVKKRTIGIFLFPGFELLDVFGPAEMFGVVNVLPETEGVLEVLMIAEEPGQVESAQGTKVVVDATFTDAPDLDILLVPGGMGTREQVRNETVLDWLRNQAETVEWLTSVCTGSGLLAKAGVLDGYKATSNKFSFDWVTKQGPDVDWVYEARWVEDRNRMTSSGVSAGMDMSLALLDRLYGEETADMVAKFTEYSCSKDPGIDPFAAYFRKK